MSCFFGTIADIEGNTSNCYDMHQSTIHETSGFNGAEYAKGNEGVETSKGKAVLPLSTLQSVALNISGKRAKGKTGRVSINLYRTVAKTIE